MAITFLTPDSVSVADFADLRDVLTNAGSQYTDVVLISLAADITLTAGISISRAFSQITLDGTDPVSTDIRHTITDMNSTSSSQMIGVRSAGNAMSITYQNMNWLGYNYYGVFYTDGGSSYANVTLTLSAFTYTGPQLFYHAIGTARLIDCTVEITRTGTAGSPQEVGETHMLEIGGNTTLTHLDTTDVDSVFWFRGPTPSFTILEGADVHIDTVYDVAYTEMLIPFTVSANAHLSVTTSRGMCRASGRSFSSVTIEENASLELEQMSANSGIPAFFCGGTFRVAQGASVRLQTQVANAGAVLQFLAGGSPKLQLENPRSFVLYHAAASAMSFLAATSISITAGQVNHWRTATAFPAAGGLTDIPDDSWRKADASAMTLTGTATAGSTTLTSNLTTQELDGKPLTKLLLGSEHVFSAGDLPVTLDPVASNDAQLTGHTLPGAAVGITAPSVSTVVTADSGGAYACALPEPPPLGETETATANIPFLLSYASRTSEEPGEITLVSAPETIQLHLQRVSQTPVVLYGRVDPDVSLTLRDTRVHSAPWTLLASLSGPLISEQDPAHELPNSLVFVSASREIVVLSAEPTAVYTGPANGGSPLDTVVSWPADAGILLVLTDIPLFINELYTARIEWGIGDA